MEAPAGIECHKVAHIRPLLLKLRWVLVCFEVQFKVFAMTFKFLHGIGPGYCETIFSPLQPISFNQGGMVCHGLHQLRNFNCQGPRREILEYSPPRGKAAPHFPGLSEVSEVLALQTHLGLATSCLVSVLKAVPPHTHLFTFNYFILVLTAS